MRPDPPCPDVFSAVPSELLHRSNIALNNPVVDVANTEVFGIVNIEIGCLPLVVFIGLPRAGNFHIQLLNAETVLAGHDDIAQDREGCVVAGRGCDASRTVGRLGRDAAPNLVPVGLLAMQGW